MSKTSRTINQARVDVAKVSFQVSLAPHSSIKEKVSVPVTKIIKYDIKVPTTVQLDSLKRLVK